MVDINDHRTDPELHSQLGCGSAKAKDISIWIFVFCLSLFLLVLLAYALTRVTEGSVACCHHGSFPARIRETLDSWIIFFGHSCVTVLHVSLVNAFFPCWLSVKSLCFYAAYSFGSFYTKGYEQWKVKVSITASKEVVGTG